MVGMLVLLVLLAACAVGAPASGQEQCSFKVADALKMPFPDNSFDLVWSLESGEHMPEKPKPLRLQQIGYIFSWRGNE